MTYSLRDLFVVILVRKYSVVQQSWDSAHDMAGRDEPDAGTYITYELLVIGYIIRIAATGIERDITKQKKQIYCFGHRITWEWKICYFEKSSKGFGITLAHQSLLLEIIPG